MNSLLNTPRKLVVWDSEGAVCEDNTPVFAASPLLNIKKSKNGTAAASQRPSGVYTAETVKRLAVGFQQDYVFIPMILTQVNKCVCVCVLQYILTFSLTNQLVQTAAPGDRGPSFSQLIGAFSTEPLQIPHKGSTRVPAAAPKPQSGATSNDHTTAGRHQSSRAALGGFLGLQPPRGAILVGR